MKFGGNQELWGDGEIYLSYSEVCFQKHEELEFEEKKKEEEEKKTTTNPKFKCYKK